MRGLLQREIEDVGRCAFNREAQIDHCDVKVIHPDGSILIGTTESRYSFDAHKILKMIVTPKMITDTPFSDAPFDAFPVRCPEVTVWSILNEKGSPRWWRRFIAARRRPVVTPGDFQKLQYW